MSIKIASWNVNSIKARLEHVKKWLTVNQPDLLLMQELKGLEFPTAEFEELGYKSEAVTQKAYNGVAILSKEPQKIILDHLPDNKDDDQARYLEVNYPSAPPAGSRQKQNLRVINIYLPNGNPVSAESEKYPYKLEWMERLYDRLAALRQENIPFVIGGDFNVIPEDKDCYDPKSWEGDALFRPETHAKWRALLNLGLTDAFRINNTADNNYTFWDYQRGSWPQNKGIRIDHFLLSPAITDRFKDIQIDKTPRGEEKPSDHTPIILELNE